MNVNIGKPEKKLTVVPLKHPVPEGLEPHLSKKPPMRPAGGEAVQPKVRETVLA
jgi:hypothetical protein